MTQFLQFLLSGLTVGAVIGVTGLAITIVYRVSGILNMAQGEFLMLGALGTAWLGEHSVPRLLGAVVVTAVVAIASLAFALVTVVPAQRRRAPLLNQILITLALSATLQGVGLLIFGNNLQSSRPFVARPPISLGGAVISWQATFLLLLAVVVAIMLGAYFRFTIAGKAMIACSDNQAGAESIGISVPRMTAWAFVMAAALGSISGVVMLPIRPLSYLSGFGLAMSGLAAAAMVGLRSPQAALGAGLAVGVLQAMVSGYISSSLQGIVVFAILITALLTRPSLIPEGSH